MKKIMKAAWTLALAAPLAASAVTPTVSWTAWVNAGSGSLTQNAQTINVTYTGDTIGLDYSSNIYDVPSSFTNAEVTNTPGSNGTILMTGGNATVNHFHFSQAVVDPYIDMFSVGQSGVPVSFVFQNGSFTILSQGAGHWGGGTLVSSGLTVTGYEGNGLLKFSGTYTDISFVTPNSEYYYGATVGAAITSPVPEPESYAMLAAGLGLLGAVVSRRKAAS
ncbi:PEP-CTERM sorting domain-containing protein [Duganella sp. BJB488]|uniref:PEP-CTERM sorting domain-containing protein n=1 Tax=unclassified Duganella TaxID=2636909 RepID=UPI000E348B5D|nr:MULTISPECIES: PEP-CTERM sorting domain-containing protein [unclassified Duganella]RFP24094.1 PEP-CTERM sorting domain-containing protein [Duganella sp. BJB489]RFP26456.1 PEP-CTERM sorting domain-containing protein [Duganella sp. BJB488]RFP34813.1 PEP-CTERM sorting domain-containing protein [Duganella sp. BJB480]